MNAFILNILVGTGVLGFIAGVTGVFTYLNRKTLIADAISHAVLPGVCIGFLVVGYKNPYILFTGAVVSGWLSTLFNDWLVEHTRIKKDAAIAITLSAFFALGIMMLTYIQASGNARQSGLENYLFGKAASLTRQDVWLFIGCSLFLSLLIRLFLKELKLVLFNADFARIRGLPVRLLRFLLSTLTVMVIAAGIQAVGVVMMAALVIIPAASGRFWTARFNTLLLLSGALGAAGALGGTVYSLWVPGIPTGAAIVVCISLLALVSILVGTEKGMIRRWQLQRQNRKLINQENVLKLFHRRVENGGTPFESRSVAELMEFRELPEKQVREGLKWLKQEGFVRRQGKLWQLCEAGWDKARTVVRRHRLWELYLTQKLHFADDHVHHDAEAMEHIITDEMEQRLLKELGFPEKDPHQKDIPR